MIRRVVRFGAAVALCFGLAVLPVSSAPAAPPGYVLTWSDEFAGGSLDPSKWDYRGLGPSRDAINVTDAVALGGGNLTITTYTAAGVHYTGMIGTRDLFQQQYGYYEARIQFSGAGGMWSAFWMKSPTWGEPPGDPAVAGTEVDIVEHRRYGLLNLSNLSNAAHFAVHWIGADSNLQSEKKLVDNLGLAGGFHLFGLDWDPAGYRFYVDGQLRWTCSDAVSRRDHYLILSSHVEDSLTSWAGIIPSGGYGSLASSTTKMTVDYVRVYAIPEPSTLALLGIGLVGLLCYAWLRRK